EDPTAHPNAFLAKEDRPFGRKLDGKHHEREHRKENEQAEGGCKDRNHLTNELLRGPQPEAFAIEKIGRTQAIELDFAIEPLTQGAVVLNDDALETEHQQFLHGQLAALVLHGNDDATHRGSGVRELIEFADPYLFALGRFELYVFPIQHLHAE